MQYIILLTGCINPNGMAFTSLTDTTIRLRQYITAINYYLHNTKYPIVFSENSGTSINKYFNSYTDNKRLELLSFNGNHCKERGKGYGEAEIIEYALKHSLIISSYKDNCSIIKITGRLIIKNIKELIENKFNFQDKKSIIATYNSNFSFVDTRIIIAPFDFFKSFIIHKNDINDQTNSFFENVFSDCIKNNNKYRYYPFYIEPLIKGQSGTTGEVYTQPIPSSGRHLHYLMYEIKLLLTYDTNYSNKKLNIIIKTFYHISYSLLHIIIKVLEVITAIFQQKNLFM